MPNAIQNIIEWPFLNEPLYRWAIFLIALSFITFAWNGVLSLMM